MPSLIDIRRRIRSVKSTEQITKAMKMVAAARLRKAQERVIASRPFARMFGEILRNVAGAAAVDERIASHPLLAVRAESRVHLILITTDRGFCGGFNANLIKTAQQFIAGCTAKVDLDIYGRKGRDFFRRREYVLSGEVTGISENPKFDQAKVLAKKMIERFSTGEIDSVYLVFNEFKSVMSQKVTLQHLLPIALPKDAGPAPTDYIYEQPPLDLMNALLPAYVEVEIYRAMLESAASEHAARMTAMDAATSNAGEVIDKLTLYMNRVRQASITKEIIEVVSGAAALE
jgi:F-type H+-transporting ATPase subunit gamma